MKPISDQLYVSTKAATPTLAYERCSAADLGLRESWLRDAIFGLPELAIGPCRAAGLTDDEWYPWRREYPVEVGSIDVLLLSAQGRVAIVETKLASNPELRRRVLAQALDYLTHLTAEFDKSIPDLPTREDGEAVADAQDIRESVRQRDVLVIIASDDIDARVARLSQSLFSEHLVSQWDLALVDLALFRPVSGTKGSYLVVPSLRNVVESEARQVVRVLVEGETPRAKVEVVRVTRDADTSPRQKWDERKFFDNLEAGSAPGPVRKLAYQLRDLVRDLLDSVELAWGTGREGCMVVKRHDGGLIEVYGSGKIRFRPQKFSRALGKKGAGEYRRGLQRIAPQAMRMDYPRLLPTDAAQAAPALFQLIRKTLGGAGRRT